MIFIIFIFPFTLHLSRVIFSVSDIYEVKGYFIPSPTLHHPSPFYFLVKEGEGKMKGAKDPSSLEVHEVQQLTVNW